MQAEPNFLPEVDALVSSSRIRFFYSRKRFLKHLVRLADAARDRQHYLKAGQLYTAILEVTPRNGRLHVQAGHMFKEAGNLRQAEAHYLRAQTLMPEDADLQLQLGHFYKVAGRLYESVAAYKRTAALKPDWALPQQELDALSDRFRDYMLTENPSLIATHERAETSPDQAAIPGPIFRPLTIDDVRQSGLFDADWYKKRYPDIAALGIDPLRHFTYDGASEGRVPGPGFEPDWYRDAHPEVAESGIDAFTHYVLIGRDKGYASVGPAPYTRWVDLFDTLENEDFAGIDRHLRQLALPQPQVVLAVDLLTLPSLSKAIRGLTRQRLLPKRVIVCFALDCPAEAANTCRALVGSNPMFDISHILPASISSAAPVILLDCGVELREHALYMLMNAWTPDCALIYSDEDRVDAAGARVFPQFKPDASAELLRHSDYLGQCVLLGASTTTDRLIEDLLHGRTTIAHLSREAFKQAGRRGVKHLPFILYHDHAAPRPDRHNVALPDLIDSELPTVTVIIPTRDRVELLRTCIETLRDKTDYPPDKLDVIVVDNGSETYDMAEYLRHGSSTGKFRVIAAKIPFNYSRLNNLAAQKSTSDILVLLNNDTEIQDAYWLRRLVSYAMLDDVGAVGPKLLYEDGTIQHAGIVLGIDGIASHAHLGLDFNAPGAMGLAQQTHEVSVVTGACLAIRRSVFNLVGGLDEGLPVAFNDVLLCLACINEGYRNIYVHDVWVRHAESKSRGLDDTPEKMRAFLHEAAYARSKFPGMFEHDPYYNPNLGLTSDTFYGPAFPPRTRFPWREYAASKRSRIKVLLLSASVSDADGIGAVAALQANYLAEIGYDVVVGCPDLQVAGAVGSAPILKFGRAEAAATYAVRNHIDCVIVHSWPFLKVARLLGRSPVTVLYDHGSAAFDPAYAFGEQWVAHVESVLATSAVSAILASTGVEAGLPTRGNVTVCSLGADRLGRWSPAVIPLRNEVRRSRGWNDRFVIVVDSALEQDADLGRIRDRFRAMTSHLNLEQATLVAIRRKTDRPIDLNILTLENLSAGELAGVYAAADLYLHMSGPRLAALEAASLGLPVVRLDVDRPGPDQEAIDLMTRTVVDAAAAVDRRTAMARTSTGPGWRDAFIEFEAAIARVCGTAGQPVVSAADLLSDVRQVTQSSLFDRLYYTSQYPGDAVVERDPVSHYLNHGWRERRRPSALFHGDWYLVRYPDVLAAGINPLLHYIRQPAGPYDPNPYFSNNAYIVAHPDAPRSGLAPLVHYLRRDASTLDAAYSGPRFDARFYAEAYPDIAPSTDPFVDFIERGELEGRLPTRPTQSEVDVYSISGLEEALGQTLRWTMPSAAGIHDVWSAARFCIELLCRSPALRTRFPRALSEGATGGYALWLSGHGRAYYGLPEPALALIADMFRTSISAPVLQVYLTRPDLQAAFPFALTPAGLAPLLKHLHSTHVETGKLRLEQLRWFGLVQAEHPQQGIVRTYQFSPMLQRRFPLGITLFGRHEFAAWLREVCGLKGDWLDPATWPEPSTWPEQIRQAYAAHPALHMSHASPFRSEETARALLEWFAGQDGLAAEAQARLSDPEVTAQAFKALAVPGVNVFGHFGYPSGLRTSTESLVEGYRRVGNQAALRDVWVQDDEIDPEHARYADPELYDISIIHVQPEPLFDKVFVRAGLAPRRPRTYRIGYWYWELDTIPAAWDEHVRDVDEIWTATRFVADAFRSRFDVPVHTILPGLQLPALPALGRAHFGVPEGKFLFLFTFHMTSIMERKNPLGLIRAFQTAFGRDRSVGLIIKTSFGASHPAMMAQLQDATASSSITIIDSVYTQAEVLGLMQCCDCYVSLHRSEGYGLTMAEAMLLGKPVIATAYSGNLDFMSPETSLLVDYKLVTLDRPFGPYEVGTRWAEPSVRHAAECMRRVVENRDWARGLGQSAQKDLTERMSLARSGQKMAARLAEVASRF